MNAALACLAPEHRAALGRLGGAIDLPGLDLGSLVQSAHDVKMPSLSGGGLDALARQAVRRIEVSSQISPTIAIDDPFGPRDPGGPRTDEGGGGLVDFAMKLVKPKLVVTTAAGPKTIAPWGEPTGSYLPLLLGGALLLGVGLVGTVGFIARRF